MTAPGGTDERRQRVVDCLAEHMDDGASLGDALCATSVEILQLAGAGINLHSSSGTPHSFGVCGPAMGTIHDLERTLGEGPCISAYDDEVTTDEPDLLASRSTRWPAFRTEALRTDARAVFGYPLMFGDICFGALNLYATEAGDLTLTSTSTRSSSPT